MNLISTPKCETWRNTATNTNYTKDEEKNLDTDQDEVINHILHITSQLDANMAKKTYVTDKAATYI